jgi:hypothetical protein
MKKTDKDFDQLSWHDCHIWGIGWRTGDPDKQDWTSDLEFDIDYIVEWVCTAPTECRFRVAPAMLVFHGITDSRINIDWGDSSLQVSLHPISIDGIDREPIQNQKVFLDRPYYRWKVRLNWPQSSEISFGAVGFTQTLRTEAVWTDQQYLSCDQRALLK